MVTVAIASNVAQERRGLALPALQDEGGYFASKDRYDTAFGDLLLTIFTPIGSRPGNRAFGSALHKILFEPDVLDRPQMVEHVINQAAQRWCPHVRIWKIIITGEGKVVQLRIVFGLVDEETYDERLIEVSQDKVRILSARAREQ